MGKFTGYGNTVPTLENLSCPIDKLPLVKHEKSLLCPNGHSYDIAKSGYVNLLPVQNKRSKDPGDSKEMVQARQAFLNLHHYFPIVEEIIATCPKSLMGKEKVRLLDAGCGEGYYLEALAKGFEAQNRPMERVGLDISKWAITAASKRDKNTSWIVGSNASLPTPDARFDAVLCLFGFPVFAEFHRALSSDGVLLLVESGPDHLIEMREILYPSIHEYKETHQSGVEGFELIQESHLRYAFSLNSQEEIQQLLCMTPHIHKASYEGKDALKQRNEITLTTNIHLRWYQKKIMEDSHVE